MKNREMLLNFLAAGTIVLALGVMLFVAVILPQQVATGSVTQGNEYNSTTTRDSTRGELLLKTGGGSLGSVLITNQLGTQEIFSLYDATTSNINLRTGNAPTSSILLADFSGTGNNSFKGTAQFDSVFRTGLLWVSEGNGTDAPTTTITWR